MFRVVGLLLILQSVLFLGCTAFSCDTSFWLSHPVVRSDFPVEYNCSGLNAETCPVTEVLPFLDSQSYSVQDGNTL